MRGYFFLVFFTLLFQGCSDDSGISLPVLNVSDLKVDEGNDQSILNITLELSEAVDFKISLEAKSFDGTATGGLDYEPFDVVVFIEPGQSNYTLEVPIYGDEVVEKDEYFEVQLIDPFNAEIATPRAIITLLNDDEQVFRIPETGVHSPDSYEGMTLVWQDEFSAARINEQDWTFEIGTGSSGWGNNELQYYKKENASIVDGHLVIEARNEASNGSQYTSTRMITKDKQTFQYGRVDIRAVMPRGKGIWPALWMLGNNISEVSWPACGEIDIMEMIGGAETDGTTHGTIHWSNGGQHAYYGQHKSLENGVLNDEFHVYSIEWHENAITWFFDNEEFHSVDITPAELSEFHEEFFFIFNVAVGGNWPGSPDHTTVFPQWMIVDYIRVFQSVQ
ncbi:MAG: family 16 glycosylhydrolase [Cyclobacteriaceae bacterium]